MKRRIKRLALSVLVFFMVVNIVAFVHAYRFTHFSDAVEGRTPDPKELSWSKKIALLFTGVNNPRPRNTNLPSRAFLPEYVQSTERLECWKIPVPNARGVIVMFHGYAGHKSSLLERSGIFNDMGYTTVLVDFMGSGGSGGSRTSIGYAEAEQVRDCLNAFSGRDTPIYLFGASMGAAAILKASKDYNIKPDGIIIECPFGSLYKTVSARFEMMNVPAFPMAAFLTFWGGVQNGYWAFTHNPANYAKYVDAPTLLLFGKKDDRVSREEIDAIFNNLKGSKTLKTYSEQGHDVFNSNESWARDVGEFLR